MSAHTRTRMCVCVCVCVCGWVSSEGEYVSVMVVATPCRSDMTKRGAWRGKSVCACVGGWVCLEGEYVSVMVATPCKSGMTKRGVQGLCGVGRQWVGGWVGG